MWWLTLLFACTNGNAEKPVASDTDDGPPLSGDGADEAIDTGDGDDSDAPSAYGSTTDLKADLEALCAPLWFMSESDYPLVPFDIADAFPTSEATLRDDVRDFYEPREYEPGLDERSIETTDLAWFFDRTTEEQDWWGDEERANAEDWRACRAVFDGMNDPKVFRLGEIDSTGTLSGAIDVYVVGGSASDDLVGVWTISVET
jgi:hypothetical protein